MRVDDILESALRGAQIVAPSFAFSMHKSGSSLLNGMIEAVCSQANVPSISVPDILFMHGVPGAIWEPDEHVLAFFPKGSAILWLLAIARDSHSLRAETICWLNEIFY